MLQTSGVARHNETAAHHANRHMLLQISGIARELTNVT